MGHWKGEISMVLMQLKTKELAGRQIVYNFYMLSLGEKKIIMSTKAVGVVGQGSGWQ